MSTPQLGHDVRVLERWVSQRLRVRALCLLHPGPLLLSHFDVYLSRGVNMYAMLTGTLPFTVEPFSLRALYQKMVDKAMNPLPTQLSTGNASATVG